MKLKSLFAFFTAGLITLTSVGCSQEQKAESGDTIVLGGMGPLTGDNAMYGTATMNGAKMAIEEVETLLGKKLVFDVLDDKGDATEAVNAYNKLVDNNGAVGIIGAVTSKPSASVAQASSKNNTPVVIPTGTSMDLTTYGENVFRACYTDPFQGKVMASFAAKSLNLKTAAVIYNVDSDYSVGLAESFKENFESNGGTVLSYEGYSEADKDFKSQLTNIASNDPEALFIPDYYSKVALISKQVKDVGLNSVLLGADGWDSVASVVEDSSLIEESYFCNHYSIDDSDPVVQDFVNKYKEKYNEAPNAFAALGYDSAKIMIKAIETAGNTDSTAIIEALKNTDINTVTGNITFDEDRNSVKPVTIIQIHDGDYIMYEKLNPNDL